MNMMYEASKELVPLNWESLAQNEAVWDVIKEELDKLSPYCIMKIITAAKGEGMMDEEVFMPMVKKTEVEYEELEQEDPFGDSTED